MRRACLLTPLAWRWPWPPTPCTSPSTACRHIYIPCIVLCAYVHTMHMPRTYHACTYIPCIYHGAQAHNTYHAYVLCTFVHTTYIPCIYHTSTVHTHLPCLRHGGAYMHISHICIYIYTYIYRAYATGVHACTTPCASPSIACRGSPARTCHGAALTRLHLLRRHLLGYLLWRH